MLVRKLYLLVLVGQGNLIIQSRARLPIATTEKRSAVGLKPDFWLYYFVDIFNNRVIIAEIYSVWSIFFQFNP